MASVIEHISSLFPSLFEKGTWIAWLVGILVSYVGTEISNRFVRDRYEWKLFLRIIVIDISLLVVFLVCDVGWTVYAILIVPWGYLPWRKAMLDRKKVIAGRTDGKRNNDLDRYHYLLWLESRSLTSWEIRTYLLPAMDILFEIGAIRQLEERLAHLEKQYGEEYGWKKLKSYIYHNRQEYRRMLDILIPFEKSGRLSGEESFRTILNIYCAYRNLDDTEGINIYIRKIEQMVFERKQYAVEALDDLLYHYEINGNVEGIGKILGIVDGIQTKNVNRYLEIQDLRYMHNKRIGNRQENMAMLDRMMEKYEAMVEDDEEKCRFGLRMLRLYFENDYGWKEISLLMFNNAETYLTYSPTIAFEYMEAVMNILQNAQSIRNMSLTADMQRRLSGQIVRHIDIYLPDYDRELIDLPDDFLYRKKEMLMRKVTYNRIKGELQHNVHESFCEIDRLERKIIALCRFNGEERESLHFLVVQTDDVLAYYDAIELNVSQGIKDEDIIAAHKDRDVYMDIVRRNVREIEEVIRNNEYNRTLAYYIFYLAYFQYRLGNKDAAILALHKFRETKVSIRNFTIAIQRLYQKMVADIEQ